MEPTLPLWTEWVRWAVEIVTPLAAIALFIATLLLVSKTRKVAEKTADLVKENIRSTDQLDRHHQEALLPIVYVDANVTFSREIRQDLPGLRIRLKGDLVNVGPGPATGVNLLLHPSPIVARSFYHGLIGANSRRPLQELNWWITPLPSFYFEEGQTWPFTVITKYTTLFDGMGHVYQRSHSGKREDLIIEKWEKPTIRARRLVDLSVTASDSLPSVNG